MAELSILIPTRNDAGTLALSVKELDRVVAQASMFAEVLIVDDQSEDGTIDAAVELAHEFPNLHLRVFRRTLDRPSFGGLLRYALAHAEGRYCAVVSGDGTDPVDLLPEMLRSLREGAMLAICSRYIRPGDDRTVGRSYRLYQAMYRTAIRGVLGSRVPDSTYGFRAFNRVFVQSLGLSATRFDVFPEMTFKVLLSGGSIAHLAGSPQPVGVGGAEKFKLPNEVLGYAAVLTRAALHRAGLRWF